MRYVSALPVFVVGELLAAVVFFVLRRAVGPPSDSGVAKWAVGKGILERLTLFVGLLHGFPHILIAFGALKLGTRLHDERDSHISNTYFLIGNLVSILFAMLDTIVTQALWAR
jgi:hypothetical protein